MIDRRTLGGSVGASVLAASLALTWSDAPAQSSAAAVKVSGASAGAGAGAGAERWRFSPRFRWRLFGNTPTAAWSPDGGRLAVNSANDHLGGDGHAGGNDSDDGGGPGRSVVEVFDVRDGGRRVVHEGQGYHPLWLDAVRVAYFTSEAGRPAVGVLELEGQAPSTATPGDPGRPPRVAAPYVVRQTYKLYSGTPTAVWSPDSGRLAGGLGARRRWGTARPDDRRLRLGPRAA